jgi:hypothetical protein
MLLSFAFRSKSSTRLSQNATNAVCFHITRQLSAMSVKRTASVRESQENEGSFSQVTDLGEGTSQESITRKRPRKEGSKSDVVEYTGPTNKVLPVQIEFPPKSPGTMRLAAWNVSGLVACEKKVTSHFLFFLSFARY